jgi:probable rRNA maturation factor
MPVTLASRGGPWPGLTAAELRRRARAMMHALALADEELSITLVGDEEMRVLNRDYRGKDKPTDVLAFAMREGEGARHAGPLLGDVVVSVDTARLQAGRRKRALLEEVTMLLAHGLLHLLGWDHDTPAKDRAMRAETDRLCRAAATTRVKSLKK